MEISDEAVQLLRMLGQGPGWPSVLFGVTGLEGIAPAKRMQARRMLQAKFEALNLFPVDKFKTYPIDSSEDVKAMLRQTKNIKKTDRIHKNRSFMLAEELGFTEDGKLKISGFLNMGMSVNLPVHIPGVGDFLIDSVLDQMGDTIVRPRADKQTNLNTEAEVDMLDADQTFPTEEEIAMETVSTEFQMECVLVHFQVQT